MTGTREAAPEGADGDGPEDAGTGPGPGGARDEGARDEGGSERGATTVVERVVAKVAVQAAREALGEWPAARRVPPGVDHRPRASAKLRNGTARVRVLVELGYPSDIGAQCAAVRRQVASRVKELVGVHVPDVAVGVERLHSRQLDGERSGRVR
ncbi:alkaline shock response membrane anchor protein AmaP [Streptomyces marispadix]|uniref:Alkaline shock response membrane anchor protein AmaP n=1 Tax=Streptomyces marispadix TaxID=2922868 RepID=A0ABS9STI0_9ACTN|nr:alkaline shock response membrane anchor protein AmaP [Streptomyces marispadix]MCH6159574.1 alkaline shock response membrane anchor protein AmaP [Streptomyces marispadix]